MSKYSKKRTSRTDPHAPSVYNGDLPIDPEILVQYMEYHKEVDPQQYDEESVIQESKTALYDSHIPYDIKKKLLFLLAHSSQAESYTILKEYVESPATELKEWAALAMQEIRMTVENEVYEDGKDMILSPLGGKDDMLRYYVVLSTRKNTPFTKEEKEQVQQEIDASAHFFDCEAEAVTFTAAYVVIKILIPLDIAPSVVVERILKQQKEILMYSFMATNVFKPTRKDIIPYLDDIHADDPHRVFFDIYRRSDDLLLQDFFKKKKWKAANRAAQIAVLHEIEDDERVHICVVRKGDALVGFGYARYMPTAQFGEVRAAYIDTDEVDERAFSDMITTFEMHMDQIGAAYMEVVPGFLTPATQKILTDMEYEKEEDGRYRYMLWEESE